MYINFPIESLVRVVVNEPNNMREKIRLEIFKQKYFSEIICLKNSFNSKSQIILRDNIKNIRWSII